VVPPLPTWAMPSEKPRADSGVTQSGPQDSLKYRLVGAGAVLLLGIGHIVRDLHEGASATLTFLSTASVAIQVATLSLGQGLARRRGWSRRTASGLNVLVSVAFGCVTVGLHSWGANIPPLHFLVVAIVVGLGVTGFWKLVFYYPEQLHDARTRALIAESEHRKAELARLRANLHPHFLLNTLNAVAGLLASEPRQARQLVVALGDLLRDSLVDDGEMRPLEQEAEWLRRYAEIFEIRHRGSIRFEWDLSADTLAMPIPHLLLQPLLENAIEHGALRRAGGGTVTLRSRRSDTTIVSITVSDDGPGMAFERPSGLGLRLVRDRLELAYPGAKMAIDSGSAGTSVSLELPSRERV
jgi:signal transduction histidine kinase